jgi:hypothetical protein
VAAAGNRGHKLNYFHKLRGELSAGTYFDHDGTSVMFQLLADGPFDLRIVAHGEQNDTIVMPSRMFVALPDSEYIDTLALGRGHYSIDVAAYPSCYHPADSVYEVFVRAPFNIRRSGPLSIELIGDDTDVECFGINGNFANNAEAGPAFTVAESSHNVFSPGCAPAVICVGATSYRQAIVTLDSLRHTNGEGRGGERAAYSSVGPTIDGRCKPDVMAPGNYVISSFSSHYYEAKPDAWNIKDYGVDMSEFEGRSYPWAAIYGTSMAAPVVAGAIALWLEAKPDLTPAEVMETIAATARRPLPDMDYPNNLYGYGEIDVYRGLLHILGIDAIEGISADSPMAISVASSPQPGTIALRLARQPRSEVSLRVYSLKGELLAVGRVPPSAGAGIITIGVPSARGICVVQADSGDPAFRGSVVTQW